MPTELTIRSDIGWSTPTHVYVKGHDLCRDLMGKVDFGDMAFLQVVGRLPNTRESIMFNALLVTLVEHGITPSAIATRMSVAGAPEAMQAAVAAGLTGLGSVFVGSMENAAHLLQTNLPASGERKDLLVCADTLVAHLRAEGMKVPGIGHALHRPVDPRAERLFEIAEVNGFSGKYVHFMRAISMSAQTASGKRLPVNATGAIAAIASELGIPWAIVRGIGIIARSVGLVGHVLEEFENPIARKIKAYVEEAASVHLHEPPAS